MRECGPFFAFLAEFGLVFEDGDVKCRWDVGLIFDTRLAFELDNVDTSFGKQQRLCVRSCSSTTPLVLKLVFGQTLMIDASHFLMLIVLR